MFYYLFRVRTNKPLLVPEYYILNNCYIGYVGCDHQRVRSSLEHANKIKKEYQIYASGHVVNDDKLHRLFCDSERLTKLQAEWLVNEGHGLKFEKDKTWYKVVFPNRNSSESILREVGGDKRRTIL